VGHPGPPATGSTQAVSADGGSESDDSDDFTDPNPAALAQMRAALLQAEEAEHTREMTAKAALKSSSDGAGADAGMLFGMVVDEGSAEDYERERVRKMMERRRQQHVAGASVNDYGA
jgi:hypothetical protein